MSALDEKGAMSTDEQKAAALARVRRWATGLFLIVAAIFTACELMGWRTGWRGALRAFAEAAMVGAIADWFAVNALFRRPLGIPWHTEIIPRNKAALGENLGRFMLRNFFSKKIIYKKLRSRDMAELLAQWLLRPHNARRISAEAATFLREFLRFANDEDVRRFVMEALRTKGGGPRLAPHLGALLDVMVASGRHQRLFDEALEFLRRSFHEGKPAMMEKLRARSYWFVPSFLDKKVFEELVGLADEFFEETSKDPTHEMRQRFSASAEELVRMLKGSPEFQDRVDEVLRGAALGDDVMGYFDGVWQEIKLRMLEDLEKPDSGIRRDIERYIERVARKILGDSAMREKINHNMLRVILYMAGQYREPATRFISERVRQWGSKEITEKLELQVGADLQYIRINGTVIGGAVGLVLYAISSLIGRG